MSRSGSTRARKRFAGCRSCSRSGRYRSASSSGGGWTERRPASSRPRSRRPRLRWPSTAASGGCTHSSRSWLPSLPSCSSARSSCARRRRSQRPRQQAGCSPPRIPTGRYRPSSRSSRRRCSGAGGRCVPPGPLRLRCLRRCRCSPPTCASPIARTSAPAASGRWRLRERPGRNLSPPSRRSRAATAWRSSFSQR
jgi:hypothetical protein